MKKRVMRRQYVINKKFQLGLALRFFLCMCLVALATGWAVYYAVWKTVLVEFHGVHLSRLYLAISQRLVVYGLGAIFSLSVLSIFFSHKIAGPIYKITRVLDQSTREGKRPPEIRLRRGDAFQEFAETLNRFLKKMC